jgi:hypothetical protein
MLAHLGLFGNIGIVGDGVDGVTITIGGFGTGIRCGVVVTLKGVEETTL